MSRFNLLAIVILTVALTIGAQRVYQYLARSPNPLSAQLAGVAEDTEVAILQAELAEMRSANDKIIAITVWSLGMVGVLGLLIVGYNIYQYRTVDPKLREADNKETRDTLLGVINERFSALSEQQHQRFREFISHDRERNDERETYNEAWREAQEAELNRRLELRDQRAEMEQELSESALESRFSLFERQFQSMEYERISDAIYRTRAVLGAPTAWESLRLLEAALPSERLLPTRKKSKHFPEPPATMPSGLPDFRIIRALRLLEESLESDMPVNADMLISIGHVVSNLPDLYIAYKDRIRAKLVAITPAP